MRAPAEHALDHLLDRPDLRRRLASDGFHVMTPTVGSFPFAIAFDGANMRVANNNDNTVSALPASDGFHVITPTVGTGPRAIAFDAANVWVANYGGSTVSVLRASDGVHVMMPTVGNGPHGIAFDGAFMWVANSISNTVSKHSVDKDRRSPENSCGLMLREVA